MVGAVIGEDINLICMLCACMKVIIVIIAWIAMVGAVIGEDMNLICMLFA